MPKFDKYAHYEESVQTPDAHAETFSLMHAEIRGKPARILREDFCGTFQICCSWVKLNPKNQAIGLDLDPEPIEYGFKNHFSKLKAEEKKRIEILQKNVVSTTLPKADVVAACNFSFNIFKERKTLIRYFKSVLKSLSKSGVFVLELAGGPGMIEKSRERKTYNTKRTGKFTYFWDQQKFDPITHDAYYAIHFKTSNGKMIKDAFVYDWRLWTIPELREALAEAGFRRSHVYWDVEGKDEYIRAEHGDNAYSWGAFVVGEK